MKILRSVTGKALAVLAAFTILCGILYPLAVTGISQLLFHDKANGSIIEVDGVKYGCELLGTGIYRQGIYVGTYHEHEHGDLHG